MEKMLGTGQEVVEVFRQGRDGAGCGKGGKGNDGRSLEEVVRKLFLSGLQTVYMPNNF